MKCLRLGASFKLSFSQSINSLTLVFFILDDDAYFSNFVDLIQKSDLDLMIDFVLL